MNPDLRTAAQRSAFDEWTDALREWQREIDADSEITLETKFTDRVGPEIAFGRFAGSRRWEKVSEIPAPEIKDELLRLIVWQADSEVRAVEQARQLLDSAPSEHDRNRLVRHMGEETRHGWQMAYLLVTHFGDEWRSAARDVQPEAQLGRRVLLAQLGRSRRQVPADDVRRLRLRAVRAQHRADAARGRLPPCHRLPGDAAHRRRRARAGRDPSALHQSHAGHLLRRLRRGGVEPRRENLRLGPQGALGRASRRAGARERAGARRVHRRGAQASGTAQPVATRRRAEALPDRPALQPA